MADGELLYGGGLRLQECLRLRVKDLDFERLQVTVREGKGDKDRVTLLVEAAVEPLRRHLVHVRESHEHALREGYAGVELPYALNRKYPGADREWSWQYVFPAEQPSRDPRSGAWRRHHLDPSYLQKAVARDSQVGHSEARRLPHLPAQLRHASLGGRH
jgi:integrase